MIVVLVSHPKIVYNRTSSSERRESPSINIALSFGIHSFGTVSNYMFIYSLFITKLSCIFTFMFSFQTTWLIKEKSSRKYGMIYNDTSVFCWVHFSYSFYLKRFLDIFLFFHSFCLLLRCGLSFLKVAIIYCLLESFICYFFICTVILIIK